jgi:ABC-type multidrug transport system ATPase subunit
MAAALPLGPNGAGKTTTIEIVSFLIAARFFRWQ